jgi:hypothetical protein
MLTALLTVVSIRCPSVVYVKTTEGHRMLTTVRRAVNINY